MLNNKQNKFKEIKKAKTKEELLDIWKDKKKLLIPDTDKTIDIINRHNYYRLSGYAKYFYNKERNFIEGTSFDDIYNLYLFDSQLRSLIFKLTEEIELNFRSYIASYIAHNFGPLGYLDSKNFFRINYHEKFSKIVTEKIDQYKDKPFIKWNIETYGSKLPIWILVEILSFTNLSMLYSNFKNKDQKNIITKNYSSKAIVVKPIRVRGWIQSICNVRNICAHSEKLFNINSIYLEMPVEYNKEENNTLFALLLVCKELMLDELKWNNFIKDLDNIITKYNFNKLSLLGFGYDWKHKLEK
ncbi:Abi family protein [Clostridium botulinum]|nr:Abi family protein [Clostridium botulinum]NFI54515.1 Abi family protein [Clostridium botulinum]NFL39777.1 Abi family protein [Clostridium botulinum]NFL66645.1 Abi family protein [Clostridium botulinum]NFN09628.1 Abi family protein [Clostridium botulinum]